MMTANEKPAIERLLDIVWKESLVAVGHSWELLNHSMWDAVNLAITSGFKFEPNDFDCLEKFMPGRWFRGESHYMRAVTSKNIQACIAIETYCNFGAFILDDAHGDWRGARYNVKRGRVCVGTTFPWRGEQVKATSIKAEYFVACSYTDTKMNKVKRRYKITKADILAERKARAESLVSG